MTNNIAPRLDKATDKMAKVAHVAETLTKVYDGEPAGMLTCLCQLVAEVVKLSPNPAKTMGDVGGAIFRFTQTPNIFFGETDNASPPRQTPPN